MLHRDANFLKFWAGHTLHELVYNFCTVALAMMAVTFLAATPGEVGAVNAILAAPNLILALHAGAWVDRTRFRRALLFWSAAIPAAVLGAIASWLGHLAIGHLYAAALVVGVGSLLFMVTMQAILPDLVGRALLLEAHGKSEATGAAATLLGLFAGGAIASLPSVTVMAVAAAALGLSGVAAASIRDVSRPATEANDRAGGTLVLEAIGAMFRHPVLRRLALCGFTTGFFVAMAVSVNVIYLTDLEVSPLGIGAIYAALGAGNVCGGMSIERVGGRLGPRATLVVGLLVGAAGRLLFASTAAPGWAAVLCGVGMFAAGFGYGIYVCQFWTSLQVQLPSRFAGRTSALGMFTSWAAYPLGALTTGWLCGAIGVSSVALLPSAGLAAASLWVIGARAIQWVPPEDLDQTGEVSPIE